MADCDYLLRLLVVGRRTLKNRVVLPPMTRCRAEDDHTPSALMLSYYTARAGHGLLLTEPTMVQRNYSTYGYEPGIFNAAQVDAWRKITEAVHGKGGTIFLTLHHGGRATTQSCLTSNTLVVSGPSRQGIPAGSGFSRSVECDRGGVAQPFPEVVHKLQLAEVAAVRDRFLRAAKNATAAGFDGVTIDAGNGSLVDQFLRDGVNDRTDAYGGSIENRCRFLLEVVDAAVDALGAERVAVRISPTSAYNAMSDSDPKALTQHICSELSRRKIAFLDVVRNPADEDGDPALKWARAAFGNGGVIIAGGGYTPQSAEAAIRSGEADAVAFGSQSVANPDLVKRIIHGACLAKPDFATFCTRGAAGYIDYPVMDPEDDSMAMAGFEPQASNSNSRSNSTSQRQCAVEESRGPSMAPARSRSRQNNSSNSTRGRSVSFSDHILAVDDNNSRSRSTNKATNNATSPNAKCPASATTATASASGFFGSETPADKLLRPIALKGLACKNRMVMGPLPRQRADPDHNPTDAMARYYSDRASMGLIISEPVEIEPGYHTYIRGPAVYTQTQGDAWRVVTDAVHDKGGYIFCQLHHGGRAVAVCNLEAHDYSDGGDAVERSMMMTAEEAADDANRSAATAPVNVISASTRPIQLGIVCPAAFARNGRDQPYPQTVVAIRRAKIRWLVKLYASAARKAIASGFDGVEIQAGNGFLIDQFLRSGTNCERTDEYGGSVAKRCRFLEEVVDAVVASVGKDRVGVRVSPTDPALDMRDGSPQLLCEAIASLLYARSIAYLAIANDYGFTAFNWMRPIFKRNAIFLDAPKDTRATFGDCEDMLNPAKYKRYQRAPEPTAADIELFGGNEAMAAAAAAAANARYAPDAISFALPMVANPDLADKAVFGVPFRKEDGTLLFTHGDGAGYNDYPTHKEEKREARRAALEQRESSIASGRRAGSTSANNSRSGSMANGGGGELGRANGSNNGRRLSSTGGTVASGEVPLTHTHVSQPRNRGSVQHQQPVDEAYAV